MELVNISRILPDKMVNDINIICRNFAQGEPYSMELGQLIIGKDPPKDEIGLEIIINVVCEYFRTDRSLVINKTRRQPGILYRQIIMWLANRHTTLIYIAIGDLIGGFDHSTVTHAIKTVNDLMDSDKRFAADVMRIDRKVDRIFVTDKSKAPIGVGRPRND